MIGLSLLKVSICFGGDEIRVINKPLGYNYYSGDTLLSFEGISKIVSTDSEAKEKIQQAKLWANVGGIIEFIGLGVSVFGAGKSVYERAFQPGLVMSGVGIYIIGLVPFAIITNSKIKSAVFLYNGNEKLRTGNAMPINGIGIQFSLR